MLRRVILAALLGAAAVSVPALGRECIEVVSAGGGYSFWRAVGEGANQAGKELGLDIYFRGPPNEEDRQSQATIANMIWDLHCKALVIAPNAPERAELVEQLKAQGIPTVYIDRDTGGADVAAVVATNNVEAGRLAGKEMAKALAGKGRVVLLREKEGVVSTEERARGFIEGATKAGLTVVRDAYIGTSVGDTRVRAEEVLGKLRGKFEGVFTPNESTSLGALIQLKKMGLAGKIVHIGFDTNQYLISAVRLGDLHGLVVQRPREMGYQGVYLAYRKTQGQVIEPHKIDTGVIFVTKTNMDQPDIAKELY
ncbi:ABC transporter substrate-binding protein [Pseudogulbenkiania subflava]|uniref:Ribose transport system substrate-binding protein n=1 Tax=Pseudogulbenkiania subflava DSM 22618 TaxID=1123014 RepID=A0A1Y6BYB0_9NEIS|nr:substrate-binding domain-containing protein [Pseudogulbenkiania subflava]SMF31480.1 ribose transport system substrate-binding protein [Pseudogulbenkiania subflava DSM 22618]